VGWNAVEGPLRRLFEFMKAQELNDRVAVFLRDVFTGGRGLEKPVTVRVDARVARLVLATVGKLPAREALCLRLRYGLGVARTPAREIGEMIGKVKDAKSPVTRQRVGALIARGLRRMRHPLRAEAIVRAMEGGGRES